MLAEGAPPAVSAAAGASGEVGLARGVGRGRGFGRTVGGAALDDETADARDSSLAGAGIVGRDVVIVDGCCVPLDSVVEAPSAGWTPFAVAPAAL